METSLRYRGDAKSLRIHAKEKISIDTKTHLQLQGELDTKSGAPHFFSAMIRHFYPDVSASLGVGLQYDKLGKVRYKVRGKKAFPVTTNGLISFNVKGQCDIDNEFKQWKSVGAAEFSWTIFNFQRDQDVRVKAGVELFDQIPYLQIRENNWTLNADINGRWNVRHFWCHCSIELLSFAHGDDTWLNYGSPSSSSRMSRLPLGVVQSLYA